MQAEAGQAQIARPRYDGDNRESRPVSDLSKARKRPPGVPAGFTFIPKSKHQGYRKRKGDHWIYWYPDAHRHEDHLDWEDDLSLGTGVGGIKPGNFVALIGKPGSIFAWTPDAKAHKDGKTWITPVDADDGHIHGSPVLVDPAQLQPQKSYDPEQRRKRKRKKTQKKHKFQAKKPRTTPPIPRKRENEVGWKKREREAQKERKSRREELAAKIAEGEELLARTGRRKIRSPDRIALIRAAIADAKEDLGRVRTDIGVGRLDDKPSTDAQAVVFEDSRAKPGTFLHKLENGSYPIVVFEKSDNHYNDPTAGKTKRTTGIFVPPQDVKPLFEEFDPLMGGAAMRAAKRYGIRSGESLSDVRQGAKLGFMMALRSYSGGTPFLHHAQRYANVYSMSAARDVLGGGGASIPARQMQLLHGLIAARARAGAVHGKDDVSVEEIAGQWSVTKKQTFTRQADGTESGKPHMGKVALVTAMIPLLSGDRVEDTEWMNQHEGALVPVLADPTLPAGTQYHLRQQIDSIMAEMSPHDAEILSVLFGFEHSPLEALADSTSGIRDQDKFAVNSEDLATILGLAKESDSLRTKQRKAKAAVDRAMMSFRDIAQHMGKDAIAQSSRRWNRMISRDRPELTLPSGPSFNDLSERFGGDDRVYIYGTAVRAGQGDNTAKLLEKWKAGKLSKRAREKLLADHRERQDVERLRQFRQQTAHRVVDPEDASDMGAGTDPESDWLYADEVMSSAARAVARGGLKGEPLRSGRPRNSRVWDDARFHRFMGRSQQHERAMREAQGGDNE